MGAGGAGAAVGAGAAWAVGAGVGLDCVLPPFEPDDEVLVEDDCFLAGFFFFLGSDFSAGSAADVATPLVIDADATSTGFVPGALALAVPLSLDPPPEPATKNATAKAATATATVIPI